MRFGPTHGEQAGRHACIARHARVWRASAFALAALVAIASPVGLTRRARAEDRSSIRLEKIEGGLQQAVAFTFDDSGRIWFVQKAEGDVRIYDPTTEANSRFFEVPDVVAESGQGLIGIALDPEYPDSPYVYVYATRSVEGGSLEDQVLRITARGDRGRDMTVLWSSPASTLHEHSGGRILFGPDGMLYVAVGDALHAASAQDLQSDRGKILRLSPDGHRPSDNPIRGSRAFAFGMRNSFGLAFDPLTGTLWETENGPECNDEVNRIDAGANLGWGSSGACVAPNDPLSTNRDGDDRVPPELSYTPTIAPTGIAFCDRCGLGARNEGAMFFGSYNGGAIHRALLNRNRTHVASEAIVANAPPMSLSLQVGPDHALYVSSYIAIYRLQLAHQPEAPSSTPPPPPEAPQAGAGLTSGARDEAALPSVTPGGGEDRSSALDVPEAVVVALLALAVLVGPLWLLRHRARMSARATSPPADAPR